MKMCRMWRVETRKILYSKDKKLRFTDYLETTDEKLIFCPEYDPVGYGPYTLLKTVDRNHPFWAYGDWILRQGEPETDTYAKFNYKQQNFKAGKLPPALWKTNRPGPIEDPFLREYWLKLPFEERVQSIFGCATPQECMKWFNRKDEVTWLAQNGFGLAEYRSKKIKHGLRQSVMSVKHPYKFIGFSPFKLKIEIGVPTNGKKW